MFIIIGAGGHSKVVLDILIKNNQKVIGFIDDHKTGMFCSLPILGKVNDVPSLQEEYPESKFIIGIGDNAIRKKIADSLAIHKINFGKAIHPSAEIGSETEVLEGTVIMANAVVNHSVQLGKHVIINTAATVDHDCRIADFSHISPGVNIAGGVTVEECVHVGIGSSVIQSVVIGSGSIIGAGAAVIHDIEKNTLAVGVPAKPIKKLDN